MDVTIVLFLVKMKIRTIGQVEDDSGMEIGTVLDLSRSDDQNPNQ